MHHQTASGEPGLTIYSRLWDDARARVAQLSSAHAQRAHGAILDYLGGSRALLRSLKVVAGWMMGRHNRAVEYDNSVSLGTS